MANGTWLTRALGAFGVGCGATLLLAPKPMARLTGLDGKRRQTMLRAVGARELLSSAGALVQPKTTIWPRARLAGDGMDLAVLGLSLRPRDAHRRRIGLSLAAVAGITALDAMAGRSSARAGGESRSAALHSVTINRPAAELYRFWRDFENLPRIMPHLESVESSGDGRSHWRAQAPAGKTVEWDAELIEDRPNQFIAWRSLPDADVRNSGSVRFRPAPGGRGTEVTVELRYEPPGGGIGAAVAKLFGREPQQEVSADLRAFKQVMETGEIVHSDASLKPGPQPAQPQPVGAGSRA